MENIYPKNLVDQYLKTSNKLKKIDRVVFKRFRPNVSEVLDEYKRLSIKFEEGGLYEYAAMCQLGASKCEKSVGNNVSELNSYLKSAWSFLKAEDNSGGLHHRSHRNVYIEGALKSYTLALNRIEENDVLQAAVIREITMVQPKFETTSSFSSPCHRTYDLQLSANKCLAEFDYVTALEKFTDIVDNICERKKQHLYSHLLADIEITRLLLLVALNLPPARQSPSHIKLIEYFLSVVGDFNHFDDDDDSHSNNNCNAKLLPIDLQYALSDIVIAWREHNTENLRYSMEQLLAFGSLSQVHRFLIERIIEKLVL